MVDLIFLVLFILHVGSIVGWLGAAFLFGSVLAPSIGSFTPQGRNDFSLKVMPKYLRYVFATSGAALVFGILLYAYSVVLHPTLGPSTSGIPLVQAGAVLGLIAFILVVAFVGPQGRKLVSFEKTQAGNPASASVQRKLRIGTTVVTVLLVIVLILMIAGSVV